MLVTGNTKMNEPRMQLSEGSQPNWEKSPISIIILQEIQQRVMVDINKLFQKLKGKLPDQLGSMGEDFLEVTPELSLDGCAGFSQDQVGFIQVLIEWFNIRKSINVIHYIKNIENKCDHLNSLRKILYHIQHMFMISTVSKLGIKGKSFNMTQSI